MAVAVADVRIGRQHEPLRPVAGRFRLLGEDEPQDLLDDGVVLEREQELDRPLADVAGAPGGAGVLLEAVRDGEVDHRVVGKPREDRVEGRDLRTGARDAHAAGDVTPVRGGRRRHLGFVDAARVFVGKPLRLLGIGHRADHRKGERGRRDGPDRGAGAAARPRLPRRAVRRRRSRRPRPACRSRGDTRRADAVRPRASRDPAGRRSASAARRSRSGRHGRAPARRGRGGRRSGSGRAAPSTLIRHCSAGSVPDAIARTVIVRSSSR